MRIGQRLINGNEGAFIIAEIAQAHDGSLGLAISEVVQGVYTDSISDGVSQPGMKSLAQSIDPPKPSPISALKDELNDEIPF